MSTPVSALFEQITDTLAAWCQQYSLKTLVIGYSGGLDSCVMLHMAWRFSQQYSHIHVVPVHIHHGLQASADNWAEHCIEVAASWALPCHVERVSVIPQPRTSLESLARDARYHALRHYMGPNTALLTGHHLDDQAETFLLAMKRGSGVKGLSAMGPSKPFADGQLLRPLLSYSRQQLHAYAVEHGLVWIEDTSNNDLAFDRNFLRHHIVPALNSRWQGASHSIARSAQHCAESQVLLNELADIDLGDTCVTSDSLPITLLEPLSEPRRNNLLRYWLSAHHAPMPSAAILQQVWQSVALSREDAQAQVVWQGWQIRRYQHALYLLPKTEPLQAWEPIAVNDLAQPVCFSCGRILEFQQLSDGVRLRQPDAALAVSVQFNVAGLRFRPHNRSHSRPLKKWWQEWQVPPWQRASVPLLFFGDELVAVVGYGIAADWVAVEHQSGVMPRLI